MTREELNAFAHGMRVKRKHLRMTQKQLETSVQKQGVKVGSTTIGHAETMPGRFSVFIRADIRQAVASTLGTSEQNLINIGREYIRDHGCHPCKGRSDIRDCRAHY